MIKNKLVLLAIVAVSILAPAAANAERLVSIQIGDRPFYNHGPRYWEGDYEMIWVPGHRSHHRWIHGHYIRGERRHIGRNFDRRYDFRNDNSRFEDRRYDRR